MKNFTIDSRRGCINLSSYLNYEKELCVRAVDSVSFGMDLLGCGSSSDEEEEVVAVAPPPSKVTGKTVEEVAKDACGHGKKRSVDSQGANGAAQKKPRAGPVAAKPGSSGKVAKASSHHYPVCMKKTIDALSKAVLSFSLDRSGVRMVCGGQCDQVKIYDFGAYSSHKGRALRTLAVEEDDAGKTVSSVKYSATGKKMIVSRWAPTPTIYDREGRKLISLIKGDPYIADMARTKGHVSAVTDVAWDNSKQDESGVLTASSDGSLRTWDLNDKTEFGNLVCHQVLKARDAQGRRVGVNSCAYFPTKGALIGAGCSDGSLQLWRTKGTGKYDRPHLSAYHAHSPNGSGDSGATGGTACIRFSPNGRHVLSRSGVCSGDCVRLWDLRKFSKALNTFSNVFTHHPAANCEFVKGGRSLLVPTTEGESSKLLVFDALTSAIDPVKTIPLDFGSAKAVGVCAEWHSKLDQIFVGGTDGSISILYDPKVSKRGAMLF